MKYKYLSVEFDLYNSLVIQLDIVYVILKLFPYLYILLNNKN